MKSLDFAFAGGPVGMLLIHGLTGTPLEMRAVGKALHRKGFTVHGVQLAGHCGSVDDLLATGWRDWYGSVTRGLERLGREVDHVFVGGLSMGAVMALKCAIDFPQRVSGVAAYGTTFRYDGWAIPPIARLSFLLPLICRMGIGRRRSFMESFPYGIKDARIRDRIAGAMIAGDSGAAGLPGNPWPSLADFLQVANQVERDLHRVESPCLVLHAKEDDIASVRNAQLIEERVRGDVELVLLHDSYHMITVDGERDRVADETHRFITRIVAAKSAPTKA